MDKRIKVEYTDNTNYRDEMFFSDMESARKYIEEELDNNYSDEWAMWTAEKI